MTVQQAQPRRRGRPRTFDHEKLLDQSVNVFWKYGVTGATTRVLEDELGVSQSSLYNAYGSKDELLEQSVARYEALLEAEVLSLLDTPGLQSLLAFIDAVSGWVGNDDHRGCLVMNLATEDAGNAYRLDAYRARLSGSLGACLETFVPDRSTVPAKADLLLAAILGMNVSAKCGVSKADLTRTAAALRQQVIGWQTES